jgi:hypothetical protein
MDDVLRARVASLCQPDAWHYAAPRLAGLHIADDAEPGTVADWLADAHAFAMRDARLLLARMASQPWRVEVPAADRVVVRLTDGSAWDLHLRALPERHVGRIERRESGKAQGAAAT